MMKKLLVLSSVGFLTPLFALAQFAEVNAFVGNVALFINQALVPLIFALAFIFFLYGVFKYYFFGAEDEGKREEGRSMMLWAIIAFVVMVSIWGIVNLLSEGLGLDDEQIKVIPDAPFEQN